jgi:hypothetical protein
MAMEPGKRRAIEHRCGVRRAWFAPGVGLARLHVHTTGGHEAVIHVTEYEPAGNGGGYLPLTIGFRWVYGWEGLSPEYTAKQVYRVGFREGEKVYVEGYGYHYRR